MNDAEEGRTIFVRNVNFSTDEEKLRDFFATECGPVQQCKIVKDQLTEHSRGQAFVKFRSKLVADACLLRAAADAGNGCYRLDGNNLNVCLAVTKDGLAGIKKRSDAVGGGVVGKVGGGRRNLHLARVGQIRRGSREAEGVAESELQLREQLEARCREALKNPDVFVSPTRLCVHNLPPELHDRDLRRLFRRLGGDAARVTECRVMRDTSKAEKPVPGAKVSGRSRGFAFVGFGDHDHALRALLAAAAGPVLPKEFKPRRLIVQFSLERMSALKRKAGRSDQKQQQQQQHGDDGNLVGHVPKPEGAHGGVPKAPKRRARHQAAAQKKPAGKQQQKQQRLSRKEFRRKRKEALIRDGRLKA